MRPVWEIIIPQVKPLKILEVGAYEGRSTTWLIEKCSQWGTPEIHCIDTWEGGLEHQESGAYAAEMSAVEMRFRANIDSAVRLQACSPKVVVHKGYSFHMMTQLIAGGKQEYFDLVYIDGSHQAPDVLEDAVLGFRLLRKGGLIIFDDYAWVGDPRVPIDHYSIPKPSIDAFVNIFRRRIRLVPAGGLQVYAQKL